MWQHCIDVMEHQFTDTAKRRIGERDALPVVLYECLGVVSLNCQVKSSGVV